MTESVTTRPRVRGDGKFFRRGAGKIYLKGVTYGPFVPNEAGLPFASPEQTARDFALAHELGVNLLRVYNVPPKWFLDLAAQHDLLLLVDIPWNKHLCFLDSPAECEGAREAVRRAVSSCARHPAVFAFSVVNEIQPDVVRWSGAAKVAAFIDELVLEARRIDPDCLCTFTNYPPTEFLQPQALDFICFNVYLHQRPSFTKYLSRLQMMAGSKPLLLGEFGVDSLREGEAAKCKMLAWQIELAFRAGLAGTVVFSFTDDWYHSGRQIDDWQMGLTTATREPKDSFGVVGKMFRAAPYFASPRQPKVSVIVASFNGGPTLSACLESLTRLNYPDFEIILVDDGSTDTTPQLAAQFPHVRYFRHPNNFGLSVARNTGIAAAEGEIVAFTDSDCRADEDWLFYLVEDLLKGEFAGMGGPNFLPPDDSAIAAAVMVSPGGPAHVMIDDQEAEHIPGCNMAFYKQALAEIGGFDPIFTRAGDDVDLCWRLQQAGYTIGFSPSAVVWHYRRSNVKSYLRQQRGYGEAEALLARKHPEYFNSFGGGIWRGRIYAPAKAGVQLSRPIIYHGVFGSAAFQTLYAAGPASRLMLGTTLEYHLLVALPLWVLSVTFHALLPLAVTSLLFSLSICVATGAQAALPQDKLRWWSRPLVGLLFFLQPIVRGWERYAGRLLLRPLAGQAGESQGNTHLPDGWDVPTEASYATDRHVERADFVAQIIAELDRRGWPNRSDVGWSEFDLEIQGNRWSRIQLTTAAEHHPHGAQIIRCRLQARWSLLAHVAFWSLTGLVALMLGLRGGWRSWSGLWLLLLPLFAFFLARQERNLRRPVQQLLDQLAERNMMRRSGKQRAQRTNSKRQVM